MSVPFRFRKVLPCKRNLESLKFLDASSNALVWRINFDFVKVGVRPDFNSQSLKCKALPSNQQHSISHVHFICGS